MFQLFHVLNRGVDKRVIFLDKQDHLRFIHDLFEFNNSNPTINNNFSFLHREKTVDIASQYTKKPRRLLVDILAFCLMPNHYHLLISPRSEKAVSEFMKKVNIGYAKYFNQKYKRKGTLFEGRYKSVLISREKHFLHLPYYIHANPLDLATPEWRKNQLTNYKKAKQFLESYRWSSHLDYLGKSNFSSVTKRDFLLEVFNGEKEYQKSFNDWLKSLRAEDGLKSLTLE